jgi:hypothetical protein
MDYENIFKYANLRKEEMVQSRIGLDALDKQIARAMCPELAAGYLYNVSELGRDGVLLDDKDVNPSVFEFVDVASSGFQSHLTNPARKWFSLGNASGVEGLDYSSNGLRTWYDDATLLVEKVLSVSGTYNALHEAYRQLVVLGRACIIRTEDIHTVVRHTTLIPGTYAFGFNANGEVDSVVREFAMSAREVIETYGKEVCSDQLIELANKGDIRTKIRIFQLIEPHRGKMGAPVGGPMMKSLPLDENHTYRSIHFSCDGSRFKRKILRISGFKRNPILAPRYSVSGGHLYGVGLGKRNLPSAQGLQTVTRMLYEAIAASVRPPVNAPSEMKRARINLGPGGVNYYSTSGSGQATMVNSVYASRPDIQSIHLAQQSLEMKLSRGFLNHLFMSLDQIRERAKTAYETEQILIEARQVLGPVITVWDKELLDPLVMGVFDACLDIELIQLPEGMSRESVSPQYTSLIHMAQKATGLNQVQTFLQIASGVAQLNPSALDKLDTDGAIDTAATMLQVPGRIVKPKKEVDAIRQQRAEAQAEAERQQQAMVMAQQHKLEAGTVKDLSHLPTGTDVASLLQGMNFS